MARNTPKRSHWKKGIQKIRCQAFKCKKLSRDLYEGRYLCGKHSPYRRGYIGEDI